MSKRTVELVAGLIRGRRKQLGTRWRKVTPGTQAIVVLAVLRHDQRLADMAGGNDVSASTVRRWVLEVLGLLAARAPRLDRALKKIARRGGAVVLPDGTLVRTRRRTGADNRKNYSGKHKAHGLLFLALTDEKGNLIRISSARPGRASEITTARHDKLTAGVIRNPVWTAWNAMGGTRLKDQLKGMTAIQGRFDQTGIDNMPPAYLLGFDLKGNGHAIVANGNPDTADNTTVYVPGTTSKLAGAKGDIQRMQNVWDASYQLSPGKTTSTITWIGYDAPQSIVPEAMEKHWAYEGAPKLNNFLDGLQTVQGGPDASHTTVIGHSYGSTTVGAASKAPGDFAADDIVVAGSPGMLVGDASDLEVGKDHVWSEAAHNDPVPLGGKAAHLGGYKWGVQTFHGLPYDAGYIQTVPSDEAFGAHRMAVDTSGHSDYWNKDSYSLWSQAAVATGRYNQVVYP
jgi:hypothetical protein